MARYAAAQQLLLPPAKFHIEERVGRKDRFLLVYRINPDHKGLIMHGAGDLPFPDVAFLDSHHDK